MSVASDKYHIITFGCQMNEHDSEIIAGLLEKGGYRPALSQGEAGIIILNTCCVRETAENKVFGLLGRLGKIKKNRPDLIIAMGGCMSQQEHMASRIKQRFPYVDIVFGTHNIHLLPSLIDRVKAENRQIIDVWAKNKALDCSPVPIKRAEGARAWVSIMYGCNNYCTYCIVPYVRGRERSRPQELIMEEIAELGRKGYKDITLLGQNVNSYGKDLENKQDFAGILEKVNAVGGIERIRYMTSHPRDFNDKLVETIARLPKVCEHVHLPVQAGSNRILSKMNRGYTREYYFDLVKKIRSAITNVSITTDIMVGFPGETIEDYGATFDLVEKIRFDSAFTFVYNKRTGTPAATMDDQVPDKEKVRRIQELIELQNKITLQKNEKEVGRTLECLVEGPSKTNSDLMSARTRTNKIVLFKSAPMSVGALVPLLIINYGLTHLEGQIAVDNKEGVL